MIQLQVLNKVLRDGDYNFILNNNLNEDFFSDYKQEFRFIKDHFDTYNKVPDQVTFLNKFQDFDVVAVNETDPYLIDALYKDRNRRYLATTFNKIRDLLNAGKVDEAMAAFMTSSDSMVKSQHIDCVDIVRDTSRFDKYVEKGDDYSKFYIRTGFKELDEVLGGWDRQEELAVIVARTNQGKSWILLKSAIAALEQGLKVGYYSGEMSENKVGFRFDTLVSHIANSALNRGDREVQNSYKNYIDNLDKKFSGCFKVLTPAMVGGSVGVSTLRSFIEKENLDVLFIDQHSLLEDDRKGRSPVEKASNISKDLKMLQVNTHIPIISVSQQNREKNEDGPDTTSIAQADRIGQDATSIVFITQDSGIMTLHLVKSRDSVNGVRFNYAIDLNKGIFDYIPSADEAAEHAASLMNKEAEDDDVIHIDAEYDVF